MKLLLQIIIVVLLGGLTSSLGYGQNRDVRSQRLVLDDNNGNTVAIQTPAGPITGGTLTIPDPAGSGSFLITTPSSGSQSVSGHLLPGTSNTYDLGSGTFLWRSLFLGTNAQIGGSLRLIEPGGGSDYSAFIAQTQANNITYTLPGTNGSTGQLLRIASSPAPTSTAATLEWATVNSGWSLTGNGGLTDGTDNFFGTTGAVPVRFITSNAERMRLTSAGVLGIGTTTPNANSIMELNRTSATLNTSGTFFAQRIDYSSQGTGPVINLYGLYADVYGTDDSAVGLHVIARGGNNVAGRFVATNGGLGIHVAQGNVLLSNTGTASELRFAEPSGSGTDYTSFMAQAQTNNITYTLPSSTGSAGQVLQLASSPAPTASTATLTWGNGTAWTLTGNGGTNPTTNYLGTTDNQAFEIRVDNGGTATEGRRRVMRYEPNATSANLIGGFNGNSVTSGAVGATIAGGGANGSTNLVTDDYGVVSGGQNNRAGDNGGTTSDRSYATVGGGLSNVASGSYSTVGGGNTNTASALASTVGGGNTNTASALVSTVGGGENNTASGEFSTVGGGFGNTALVGSSTVGGGENNTAFEFSSTVGGGLNNVAFGFGSTVGGGLNNTASGISSTVGGGARNTAAGDLSAIAGGRGLTLDANADRSFGFHANPGTGPGDRDMTISSAEVAVFGNTDLWLANNDNAPSELRFFEAYNTAGVFPNGTNYTALKAATTQASDITYTLPDAAPASNGEVLTATTGGVMSWSSPTSIAWSLTGNSGTTAGTNYLGTTDNQAFEIRVDNGGTATEGRRRVMRFEPNASSANIIGGFNGNSVTSGAVGATIAGGGSNGSTNLVTDNYGVVSGGENNRAGDNGGTTSDRSYATVGGGLRNTASGELSTVGGGLFNTASGLRSTVGGGDGNTASGAYSTVGAGLSNTASSNSSTVGGGFGNTASGLNSTVGGGTGNTASGFTSTAGGGGGNTASGDVSTVGGGDGNTASALASTVGGGEFNTAAGDYSVIAGGRGLTLDANADRSFGFHANTDPGDRDMTIAASDVAVFGNTDLWLANNDNAPSELRFFEAYNTAGAFPSGTNYTALKAATTQASDITYTLPDAAPTSNGQMLTSTTGGTMSWGRKITKATVSQDIASVAANSASTETFTVTGAAVGGSVAISPSANLTAGLIISFVRVSAANTVTVGFQNVTGSAIDEGSLNWDISVIE